MNELDVLLRISEQLKAIYVMLVKIEKNTKAGSLEL